MPEGQALAELGQSDEDEREQHATVPRVVEQEVEMIERVLVEEVRLVEQEHGVRALGGGLLDVLAERIEQAAGSGGRREPDGVAELAIEVAAPERGIVAVGEPEAGGRDAVAERVSAQVLPTPGSPTRTTKARSSSASSSVSTTASFDDGSHNSASEISLVNGER